MCYRDPAFRCEESDHPMRSRSFVCGDGQKTYLRFPDINDSPSWVSCMNGQDVAVETALLSQVEHSNLSYDCWLLLYCATTGIGNAECDTLCDEDDWLGCTINIWEICHTQYVVFPRRPILQGHVLFVYSTKTTINFATAEVSLFPDYVCYDIKRCPFLQNTSILNITNKTCQSIHDLHVKQMSDIIQLFQTCLTIVDDENDINITRASLFQCPGTTKRISGHRVLDGVIDCYGGIDEKFANACQWDNKYRFKCLSENKCISNNLLHDSIKDCLGGEDELSNLLEQVTFQKLCNGYVHLSPILVDGFNETDETHCDEWECNNLYTRCDGAWNCPNGADELNCIATKCASDSHECISPETGKIICLPVNQSGDARKSHHTYVIVRNATASGKPMYGFSIFDSEEKRHLYRIRISSTEVDTAILIDNYRKNIVANLKGIWIEKLVNVSFSVYDSKLGKWTDGFIQRNTHTYEDYTIHFNNQRLSAKSSRFSKNIKVYTQQQNELLAQFRYRTRWLSWRPVKYDLNIYSTKVPDAVYFFLVLIIDHRGFAGEN
ncbi:unnamed protein product [Rotaria sp. Silwood1]|nr:unnamed protein product [Rotaria sp. Silwood1]